MYMCYPHPRRICDCPDKSSTIKCLEHNMADWKGPFGVLLFLYSIVLTKVCFSLCHWYISPSIHSPLHLLAHLCIHLFYYSSITGCWSNFRRERRNRAASSWPFTWTWQVRVKIESYIYFLSHAVRVWLIYYLSDEQLLMCLI